MKRNNCKYSSRRQKLPKKQQIITETPISWTTLSIVNQEAAEICNIKNLFQPEIRHNH